MSNQKEKTTAQAAGMNRAKPYQLVLFPMNSWKHYFTITRQ